MFPLVRTKPHTFIVGAGLQGDECVPTGTARSSRASIPPVVSRQRRVDDRGIDILAFSRAYNFLRYASDATTPQPSLLLAPSADNVDLLLCSSAPATTAHSTRRCRKASARSSNRLASFAPPPMVDPRRGYCLVLVSSPITSIPCWTTARVILACGLNWKDRLGCQRKARPSPRRPQAHQTPDCRRWGRNGTWSATDCRQCPVCSGLAIDLYCFSENHEGYMARTASPLAVATIAMPSEAASRSSRSAPSHTSIRPSSFTLRLQLPGPNEQLYHGRTEQAAARRRSRQRTSSDSYGGTRDVQRAFEAMPALT